MTDDADDELIRAAREKRAEGDLRASRALLEEAAWLGSHRAVELLDAWHPLDRCTAAVIRGLRGEEDADQPPGEPPPRTEVARWIHEITTSPRYEEATAELAKRTFYDDLGRPVRPARVRLEHVLDFAQSDDRSDPRVFRVFERLLCSADFSDRVDAVSLLEVMTHERAARAVLSATKDPDAIVRRRARGALSTMRFAQEKLAIDVLAALDEGLHEERAWSRAYAIGALASFVGSLLIRRAETALADGEEKVREAAAESLATLVERIERDGPPFLGRAGGDRAVRVRWKLLRSVRAFYSNDLWKALEPLVADVDADIASDAEWIVREHRPEGD